MKTKLLKFISGFRFEKRPGSHITVLAIFALLIQLFTPFMVGKVEAAGNLSYAMVRFDRMKINSATTGTVCAKTNGATQTETNVKVTFPTGYTLGAFGTFTIGTTTTGWPPDPATAAAATAWPGIGTATNVTGQVVTFPSNDLAINTWYCFNWINTAAVQIKSSATSNNTGTVITQATGSVDLDTGNYATASVSDDQIAATATVPPSFVFSVGNTAALGTLSTTAPSQATVNATVSTNATKGWDIWGADTTGTPGLTSTTASKTIAFTPSPGSASANLANGAEGINLGVSTTAGWTGTCNGTKTADPNYVATAANQGGGLDATLRILALADSTANACVIPLKVNAGMNGTTPAAADYNTAINVVAAGRF